MKILFAEIDRWEEEIVTKALGQEVEFTQEKITAETAAKYTEAEILSCFIYSTLTKEVLEKLPKLKLIVTRSTGFDHIDIDYCKTRGIIVCNVPSYGASAVAEHTFALILALSRKIIPSVERTRKGDFSLEGLTGFELKGKTIGIIGFGNIGKAVTKIAESFGMQVLAYSHHKDESVLTVAWVDLEDLLARSDIVSLHLPLTKETEHIINMQNIQKFKKGALLINTARGGLVQTQAIVEGLTKGILGGAGLDTLEGECDIREERELLSTDFLAKCDLRTQLLNHVLLDRTDVLVTPHNAFNTKESLQEILDTTVKNVQGFLHDSLQNEVKV